MEKRRTISDDRLDLVDRHRRTLAVLEAEQPAQRHQPLGLLVDRRGVLLEDVVATGPRRVLQPEHRLRVEQVQLALATPLVLAADVERAVRGSRSAREGRRRACRARDLLCEHLETDAAELGRRAGEVAVHELLVEPDRLEDLRPVVGRDGRDAHLRHHLEHALAERLDQVAHGLLRRDARAPGRARPGPRRSPSPGRG